MLREKNWCPVGYLELSIKHFTYSLAWGWQFYHWEPQLKIEVNKETRCMLCFSLLCILFLLVIQLLPIVIQF